MIRIDIERLRENTREEQMDGDFVPVKKLRPVFTGKTEEGEEVTLYQHIDRPTEIHILLANGLQMLPMGLTEITTWSDPDRYEMRVDINSPVWTGQARGNRWELLQADMR